MTYDLEARIIELMPEFSKGQKKIAQFILEHGEKAAYMTALALGNSVGVSESTVVRFAERLGFEGYPEFQRALQELMKSKLTSVQRVELSASRINEKEVLKSVLLSDMDKIKQTLEQIDENVFNHVVDEIVNAKRIYIIGIRSSAALADFLGFYLNMILDNVKVITTSGISDIFEQVFRITSDDLIIGISFPRYSKRTLKVLQYAKKQGAKIVSLTDSKISPLCKYSDYVLICRSDMVSFADSLVAPLSVINALIVATGLRKKEEVAKTLEKLEEIWDEFQVYEKENR
ncbi:RpiR family transcriptional regulator [Caldicellulosiruptor bescii]|uniref:Transcriptional regulator, RpiR family n=2 Tax=Caldicellulosiruptor bescii TaxID=31899 RepID=B9MRW7_CALBD|nr:MurR/RpiR family transcriptional regulator [Caldicellulosiruptor bescii]ACM60421.1 transcriptional regulator, RpiR family [Caldicellulosiruptor bescii DSM 6725]PBC87835.1 RpiR family transcriptional regulator [Caldicellulosiruptor bescii]PBC90767.1 RpiR family transcriptional regulator [Caldicellulosiruptor bescii]PBD03800.1 RpiR family transcriptional regulator [Caldicellulosiruptor bescii]PBD06565.1 RpiR family transcriptional regulator [Caldicellulosiruptor bescii]